eukprot:6633403-Alexandrium_andersonii.AAC.1
MPAPAAPAAREADAAPGTHNRRRRGRRRHPRPPSSSQTPTADVQGRAIERQVRRIGGPAVDRPQT